MLHTIYTIMGRLSTLFTVEATTSFPWQQELGSMILEHVEFWTDINFWPGHS